MAIDKKMQVEFLKRVAGGRSVRDVCRDDDMPARSVIYEVLAESKEFADHYARACDMRADEVFDETFEIADNATNDWMQRQGEESPGWIENGEAIRRSALRIDTRKWALARMSPRKYGDKLALGGADDLPPIKSEAISDTEFARRVAFALAKGMKESENE